MRITRVGVRLVSVPQEAPLLLSRGRRFETVPHVLVRLGTAEGLEGVGWAYRLGMADASPVAKTAADMVHALVGEDALQREAVREKLLAGRYSVRLPEPVSMAMSAIDIALWDIAGKAAGLPLWRLLGGARDRVAAYASGSLWRIVGPDGLRDAVERHKARGFRAVKVRLGEAVTPEMEAARVAAVRGALGRDGTLLADVNQGWDADKALEVARHIECYRLGWLEDPVGQNDLDGMVAVSQGLETAVCAGEHCFSKEEALRLLERRAVDVLMADVLRVGGITEWRKIAALAEAFGVPITAHLTPEVSLHLVAASSNGHFVECMPVSAPLFKEGLTIENGEAVAPSAPGLGVELDEAMVLVYSVD